VLGCSNKEARPTPKAPAAVSDAAVAADDAASASDGLPGKERLLANTGQLIVVTTASWSANRGGLQRFDWKDGAYRKIGPAVEVTIGHAGLGWGQGYASKPELGGPKKVEGDGRSPAGMFAIGDAYGYAAAPPAGTGVDYQQLDDTHRCVDDPKSKSYNRIVSTRDVNEDWRSAETMRRQDVLYRWVLEIAHNPAITPGPIPGAGSCIFFHVWGPDHGPTVGCAAMDQSQLEDMLGWLDPKHGPKVVMLPRPVYQQLRPEWGLPAL
jgi:D-alanyl-D-alanine dipeptidase